MDKIDSLSIWRLEVLLYLLQRAAKMKQLSENSVYHRWTKRQAGFSGCCGKGAYEGAVFCVPVCVCGLQRR